MTSSPVRISPPRYNGEQDETFSSPTYKDYVQALRVRNPSLTTLHSFLANPNTRNRACRATALDFCHGTFAPATRSVSDLGCLLSKLGSFGISDPREKESGAGSYVQGRILIIEDLTVDVIQMLGSELDLDPLFLAAHLHTVHRTGMRHQTPDDATLPSRLYDNDYVNISYHQPLTSDIAHPSGNKFSLDAAIDRKLVFLRATSIGLAQHRVSIIKLRRSPEFWLALILVDPPLGDTYFRCENKGNPEYKVTLNLNPYMGSYENFMPLPKFSEAWDQSARKPRGGMLDDLVHYWTEAIPECFDPADPSIQSLAYYPLRIVAAEWVKYIAVMQHCIKMYEYEGSQLDLEKFNMDLRELQGWRRRSMRSRQKVRSAIRHLEAHKSSSPQHTASVDLVLQDFTVISNDIEDAGRRLENMLPVVTSLVQIIDARQSFAETANISRLTVLALIFVPLSYVSSLFSMNTDNMPGSRRFWVYFAVAIPVTFIVFLIARPPTVEGLRRSWARLLKLTKREPRRTGLEAEVKCISESKEEDWVRVRSETMRL